MIAKYLPLSAVGIYSIAAFIPTVIEAPLFSLDKIAGAKIAHAITHNDRDEIQKIYYKSSKYMLIVGGLLFIGINANISDLLSMLPEEYAGGINVVFIISLGTLFTMLSGANTNIIFNSDKYVFGAFLLIFLAISAFVLNVLLIPIMGIEGAALATALAALIYNLVKYLYIWKHFDLQPFNLNTLWVILLTFACLFLGFALPSMFHPLFSIAYRSVVLTLIYTLAIVLFKFEPEINKQLQILKEKYL
jgi:O-antigen/teichoic acid export membrane protein